MNIEIIPAYEKKNEIKELFTEYTDMLVEGNAEFRNYLILQNYDEEVDNLEKLYGYPWGRLYIAYCDGKVCGSIGIKRMNDAECELKRLYVKPEFRKQGIGNILVDKVIAEAKEIGYKAMFLDTLPFLKTAIKIYRQKGFVEIESYNGTPMEGLVYLKLELQNLNMKEKVDLEK